MLPPRVYSLEHRSFPQHVWHYNEDYLTASDVQLLHCRGLATRVYPQNVLYVSESMHVNRFIDQMSPMRV